MSVQLEKPDSHFILNVTELLKKMNVLCQKLETLQWKKFWLKSVILISSSETVSNKGWYYIKVVAVKSKIHVKKGDLKPILVCNF